MSSHADGQTMVAPSAPAIGAGHGARQEDHDHERNQPHTERRQLGAEHAHPARSLDEDGLQGVPPVLTSDGQDPQHQGEDPAEEGEPAQQGVREAVGQQRIQRWLLRPFDAAPVGEVGQQI
jgi:hypothetical protein